MVTSSDYKEELKSLEMCPKITETRTYNKVLQIEMSESNTSSTLGNELEEKNKFYVKTMKNY